MDSEYARAIAYPYGSRDGAPAPLASFARTGGDDPGSKRSAVAFSPQRMSMIVERQTSRPLAENSSRR